MFEFFDTFFGTKMIFIFSLIALAAAGFFIMKGAFKSFAGRRVIQLSFLLVGIVVELVILYLILFILLFGYNS